MAHVHYSKTSQYLKGKTVGGLTSPIEKVLVMDSRNRKIVLEDGKQVILSKKKLTAVLHEALSNEGRTTAQQSIKKLRNGKVSVVIGGAVRGEKKVYATVAAARGAVTRHYGKSVL